LQAFKKNYIEKNRHCLNFETLIIRVIEAQKIKDCTDGRNNHINDTLCSSSLSSPMMERDEEEMMMTLILFFVFFCCATSSSASKRQPHTMESCISGDVMRKIMG
jgi:hypothetical protein